MLSANLVVMLAALLAVEPGRAESLISATARVDGSSVIGNSTGLSFSGGGKLFSFGNNNVEANGSNGTFSGPVALK